MLRRVMQIRAQIGEERDPNKWAGQARVLQAFYHDHQIYSEALPLDRKLHEQSPSADSALLLSESQLALGMNSEAAHTLRSLGKAEATPRAKVLLGIALARQGEIDEAKALVREGTPKRDAEPRVLYELARLWALVGNAAGAGHALSQSFELTPVGELDAAKADARACPDFGKLVGTPEFAKALETRSLVGEVKDPKVRKKGCARCGKRARCVGCAKKGGKGTPGRKATGSSPKPKP